MKLSVCSLKPKIKPHLHAPGVPSGSKEKKTVRLSENVKGF